MPSQILPACEESGKIDPKQIPRIQSQLLRITDINEGKCIKEVGLEGVVESRVATAGMLMHKNPLGRDNRHGNTALIEARSR